MAEQSRFKIVLSCYEDTRSPQIQLLDGDEQVISVVLKWGTTWQQARIEIFNFKRISGFVPDGCSMDPLLKDARSQWYKLGFENGQN